MILNLKRAKSYFRRLHFDKVFTIILLRHDIKMKTIIIFLSAVMFAGVLHADTTNAVPVRQLSGLRVSGAEKIVYRRDSRTQNLPDGIGEQDTGGDPLKLAPPC